jgi:hypothetical protein
MQLISRRTIVIVTTALGIMLFVLGGVLLVEPGGAANSSSSAPALQENTRARLVRVWVHGDAIYPETLRIPPGKVLIRAENETQSEINLIVERVRPGQANQSVARVRAVVDQKRANQEMTLGVGEYVYYDESQPQYKGTLIVEPKSGQ